MLPIIAGPAFGRLCHLNLTATRLTEASTEAFTKFLGEQFPEGRRLVIELRMLNIRKMDFKSKVDPSKEFRKKLTAARKARPHANIVLKF